MLELLILTLLGGWLLLALRICRCHRSGCCGDCSACHGCNHR